MNYERTPAPWWRLRRSVVVPVATALCGLVIGFLAGRAELRWEFRRDIKRVQGQGDPPSLDEMKKPIERMGGTPGTPDNQGIRHASTLNRSEQSLKTFLEDYSRLPSDAEAAELLDDGLNEFPVRYRRTDTGAKVTISGPDRRLDTEDDVSAEIAADLTFGEWRATASE